MIEAVVTNQMRLFQIVSVAILIVGNPNVLLVLLVAYLNFAPLWTDIMLKLGLRIFVLLNSDFVLRGYTHVSWVNHAGSIARVNLLIEMLATVDFTVKDAKLGRTRPLKVDLLA